MAAVAEVCQTISAAAGVPLRLVEYLARRLGEAGQLPRGPRGRHAPHFEDIHIARLLVAVMVVADGIDFTGASIALAMTRIEELSRGGEARVDVYVDRDLADPQCEIVLMPAGSFVDNVAFLIRQTQAPSSRDDYPSTAVGLTFGSGNGYGWIEYGKKTLDQPSDIQRVNFGLMSAVLKSGMKQEVRVERDVLFRLGELLGDIPLGPQDEFSLSPTSSTSSETTTPAQGGAGPASIVKSSKVNRPGCKPGQSCRWTCRPHQQDSDAKKREQSPPLFSSHGSPSSDRSNQRKDEPPWPN